MSNIDSFVCFLISRAKLESKDSDRRTVEATRPLGKEYRGTGWLPDGPSVIIIIIAGRAYTHTYTQMQIFRNPPTSRDGAGLQIFRLTAMQEDAGTSQEQCKRAVEGHRPYKPQNNNKPVCAAGIAKSSSRPARASCSRARNSAAGSAATSDSVWPKVLSSKASIFGF